MWYPVLDSPKGTLGGTGLGDGPRVNSRQNILSAGSVFCDGGDNRDNDDDDDDYDYDDNDIQAFISTFFFAFHYRWR